MPEYFIYNIFILIKPVVIPYALWMGVLSTPIRTEMFWKKMKGISENNFVFSLRRQMDSPHVNKMLLTV